MTDRFNSGRTHVRGNESMSAGEFALFFQEDEQSEDAVSLEVSRQNRMFKATQLRESLANGPVVGTRDG